jgi:hypothetical protein
MDAPTLITGRKPNPTEAIELGARVTFLLDEEAAVIEATKHYDTCPKYFPAPGNLPILPDDECKFCLYGPIDDIGQYLVGLRFFDEKRLGDAWYF